MGGDMESAAAVLAAVRQNNVATPETLLLTAYVALQRGDRAAAVEAAEAALRMDKDLAPARRLLERATAVASPAVSEQSLHGEGDGEAP